MSTDDRIRKRASFRKPLFILGVCMTIFYVCLGVWILLDKTFLTGIPAEFRHVFAFMVLIYGTYRGWRVYADYF